ncbi:MAG TPA: hypothetical protein VFA21_20475 [Pyrinomonadaceae bacterium]|jgi:hypothetical protein|nr:hypothetical protein [Pyrinomonadaceae bacterium]
MEHGIGNAPVVALAFVSSLFGAGVFTSVAPLAGSLLAALLVGLLSKGVDILVKHWFAYRRERWRVRALEAEAELAELKRR